MYDLCADFSTPSKINPMDWISGEICEEAGWSVQCRSVRIGFGNHFGNIVVRRLVRTDPLPNSKLVDTIEIGLSLFLLIIIVSFIVVKISQGDLYWVHSKRPKQWSLEYSNSNRDWRGPLNPKLEIALREINQQRLTIYIEDFERLCGVENRKSGYQKVGCFLSPLYYRVDFMHQLVEAKTGYVHYGTTSKNRSI